MCIRDRGGLALLAVQRQQETDHFLQLLHELMGLLEGEYEVPDFLIQACLVFQLRHIIGVGHEPVSYTHLYSCRTGQ